MARGTFETCIVDDARQQILHVDLFGRARHPGFEAGQGQQLVDQAIEVQSFALDARQCLVKAFGLLARQTDRRL
jgi:hypothetical protein